MRIVWKNFIPLVLLAGIGGGLVAHGLNEIGTPFSLQLIAAMVWGGVVGALAPPAFR